MLHILSILNTQNLLYLQNMLNQIYMTGSFPLSPTTKSLYKVQPTSNNTKPHIFPSLPYSKESLNFINKFNFQFSDHTDTEHITLCNLLVNHKHCYATHKSDKDKISSPFRIRLKPNAQLMRQRRSKVPIYCGDKLKIFLKKLQNTILLNKLVLHHMINLWYNILKSTHHYTKRRFNKVCIRRTTN